MLYNLKEWRAEIDKFLNDRQNLFTNKTALDIGLGDSTRILLGFAPDLKYLDKMEHKNDSRWIPGDLLNSASLPDQQFDVVVCCEVLEHVENPFLAAQNLDRLCAPGGKMIITVPCFLPWHPGEPHYKDYFRYMPSSLKLLFGANRTKEFVFKSTIQNMPYGIGAVVSK